MELIIKIKKTWNEAKGCYCYYSYPFLRTNENNPSDRITHDDNPAEIQRLLKLAKDVEEFVDNYSFFESDGNPNKAESSP